MRAFFAYVLSPVADALMPADRSRVGRRLRNAAATTALVSGLLPRARELGTGTLAHVNALVLTYAAVAIIAHLVMTRSRGDAIAAAGLLGAGAVVFVFGAAWGVLLGAAAFVAVALSALRRRMPPVPAPPPDPRGPPKDVSGRAFRIERIAYAVATAIVFWMVVVEHTAVPTGSMQPTIYGNHMVAGKGRSGDHVLVDRAVYHLRAPRRFEIVVFAYPLGEHVPFVKRLIGLPGEDVEIIDGDVVIDGTIARKPPAVQASVWREVFPSRDGVGKQRKIAEAWTASEDDGFKRVKEGVLRFEPRGDRAGLLRYRGRVTTPDLRVAFTAEPDDDSARVIARVITRGTEVTFECGSNGKGRLSVGGQAEAEFSAAVSGSTRVALEVADGVARALLDGAVVGELDVPRGSGRKHGAAVGGSGGAMNISRVVLAQDLFYLPAADGTFAWTVDPDSFFMLGDNAKQSEDSRAWTGRSFRVRGMDEPLVAADYLPNMQGGQDANIRRTSKELRFIDRHGVARSIPRADVLGEEGPTPMPFVPRANLRGRAALIVFPFPPFGSWRPRLLP